MSRWLQLLKTFGPMIIAATVPHGDVLAPVIIHAIEEAEGLEGATGPQKLAHAVALAVDAATIAKASGIQIEPSEVQTAAAAAISTAVTVTNIVHRAHATPAAA